MQATGFLPLLKILLGNIFTVETLLNQEYLNMHATSCSGLTSKVSDFWAERGMLRSMGNSEELLQFLCDSSQDNSSRSRVGRRFWRLSISEEEIGGFL